MADNRFDVRFTRESDGASFIVPITAIDRETAEAQLQLAFDTGQIDPHDRKMFPGPSEDAAVQKETAAAHQELIEGINLNSAGDLDVPRTLEQQSVRQGIQTTGFNVVELSLMLADAAISGLAGDTDAAGAVKKARNDVRQRRQETEAQWAADMEETYGTDEASGAGVLIGEAIALIPLGFQAGGLTFTRMLGKNFALGATAGAIASTKGAEELADIAFSTGFSGVMGAGFSMFGTIRGIKAGAGRAISHSFDTPLAQNLLKLEAKVQKMTGNPNFHFTIGELGADNPWLVGFERGVLGRKSIQMKNEKIEVLVRHLENLSNDLPPEQLASALHNTVIEVSDTLNSIGRRNYGRQMDNVLDTYGDDLILDGKAYLDDLIQEQVRMANPARIAHGKPPQAYIEHVEFVQKKVDAGGLTSNDVIEIIKGHNELINGTRSLFDGARANSDDALGRYLKSSMLRSLDGNSGGALRAITDANNSFHFDMQKVRVFKESTLGRLFGDNYQNADPDALLSQLTSSNLGRKALADTRKILSKLDADLLADLQGAAIGRIVQQSKKTAVSPAFVETDIVALINALKGPATRTVGKTTKQATGRFGLGLFSAKEQLELIQTAQALRTLRTTYVRDLALDAAGIISDAGINAISRNAAFMTRFVLRMLGKGEILESIMVDPNMRKALIAMAEHGPNTMAFKQAALWAGTWLGHDAASRKAAERDAQTADLQQRQIEEGGF